MLGFRAKIAPAPAPAPPRWPQAGRWCSPLVLVPVPVLDDTTKKSATGNQPVAL